MRTINIIAAMVCTLGALISFEVGNVGLGWLNLVLAFGNAALAATSRP